jgi:plastocyanin domain-containing protein
MQNIFGVLNADNVHTDVSKSEKGAKQYATRHGYTKVSIRYNNGYDVDIVAVKKGQKWVKYPN